MVNTYYDKSRRVWVAYYSDSIGQLGQCECARSRDHAAFKLGVEYGSRPQNFARPLGHYFKKETA